MRVVLDHQIFSSQAFGGVSRYFSEIYSRLHGRPGLELEIVAPVHCNAYLPRVDPSFRLKVPVFPKVYRVIQPIDQLLSKPIIRRKRPDLLHETYYQYASVAPAGCPTVLTVYDVIHERYHANFRVKDETTLRKRAALRRAAHVMAISESARQDFIEFFNVPPEKISTVHLGCSLPDRSEIVVDATEPAERPYILYVGARRGYKNFDRLLEAYAASAYLKDNFDLLVFGGGPFNAQEQEAVARCGGKGRVAQRSGDDAALFGCYARAAVFVYPSSYEGFGLPPLEAMAMGCPVACTNRSSVPEVVGDAAALFDPASVDQIRVVVEELLQSAERRERLVALGYERVNLFSWDRCAEQTLRVYSQVADCRSGT
jgi:glycosyltransferase involved in cell wall biosynthesis